MRKSVYFASDVHLGLAVGDPAGREARFVHFLKSIPKESTQALYLLGDIWDFWYEYKDVVPMGYVRVFSALLDLMDAGVQVYFFQGNHDIWTYRYFRNLGMKILKQPYVTEISGKTFCLGHGDGLGPGMYAYKLMRATFHNRFLQILFSSLHPYLAFRLGKGWSKKSRLAKSIPYKFKGKDESLYKFADEYSHRQHVDYFIFGHYHDKVDLTLATGARLLIMKDWLSSSNYLHWDGEQLISVICEG